MAETPVPGAEKDERGMNLSDLFGPAETELLGQIAQTIGFSIAPDPDAKPGDIGYKTDMRRRIVYYNPHTIDRMEPLRRFAFFAHEFGHHFPDVVAFQDACDRLGSVARQLLPPEMAQKARFLHTVVNVLADLLLESAMPKQKEIVTQELLTACFRQNRGITFIEQSHRDLPSHTPEKNEQSRQLRDRRMAAFEASGRTQFPWDTEEFAGVPAYAQFLNLHLVAPFFANGLPPPEMVAPEVAALYEGMRHRFAAMMDEHTPGDRKASFFIDTVRELVPLIEKRLEEIRQTDGGLADAIEALEGEIGELITLLKSLTAPGADTDEPTDGEASSGRPGELSDKTRRALQNLTAKGRSVGDQQLEREAAALGVTPELYRRYLEIRDRYKPLTESLTGTLTKFVLREYRKDYVSGQAEGIMVTPGRGPETYLRRRSGELSPKTMINRKRVLQPKQLQLYKLIDTSGSMVGDLDGTLGFYVVVTESSMHIQQELLNNSSLYDIKRMQSAPPLELEVTGFDSSPFVVLPLTQALDLSTLVQKFGQIINETGKGGTEDARALRFQYNRMRVQDPHTLKLLSMITDGEGDRTGIEPILRQIEEDPGIHFMVNGIGQHGEAVRDAYQRRFRPAYYYHVFADASRTVDEAVPKTIAWLEAAIETFYGEGH